MAANNAPNLDLSRGGNAMEGLYATNQQIQAICDALTNNLTTAMGNDPAAGAARNNITTALTNAKDTAKLVADLADSGRKRVGETKIPLMTKLPTFDATTDVDTLPDKRDIRLPKPFTGGSSVAEAPIECRAHLDAVMDVAKTYKFSELGTKRLLKVNVGKDLALMVGEMMEANATLEEIVRKIEVMYGGLKTTEQAQMECHKIFRFPSEPMLNLGRRIKHLAYMATRLKAEPAKALEELAIETLQAAIAIDTRQQLKALNDKRLTLGQKGMDFETLLCEAKRLEDERRTEYLVAKARHSTRDSTVRAVFNEHGEPISEESDDAMEGEVLRVFAPKNKGPRYYRKDKNKGYYRTPRKFNPQYVRQVGEFDPDEYAYEDDEIDAFEDAGIEVAGAILFVPAGNGNGRDFIKVDPKELNVTPDQCLKCGLTGHRAFGKLSANCPLKNQPMVTKPCPLCKRGGHVAATCPKRSKN